MKRMLRLSLAVLAAGLLFPTASTAESRDLVKTPAALAPGFGIPTTTLSPDKRHGISVLIDLDQIDGSKEMPAHGLYEIKTGKLIGPLRSRPSPLSANHLSVPPTRWSSDSSLLLWRACGKWADWALELVKIKDGQIDWQLDVLDTAQKAILERTRLAAPESYEMKKKENKGHGAAYPEGFTIFISTAEQDTATVKLPLQVSVSLTSSPKQSGLPEDPAHSHPTCLESTMEGSVDATGKFSVTAFRLLQKGRPAQ